jgi:hypothetical protein
MTSQRSKIHVTYTASGLSRYEIKVWHTELNKIQVIRGDEKSIVEQKAEAKIRQWDEMWEKKEKLSLAKDQTSEALLELEKLGNILKYTIAIDWASLKNKDKFLEPKPQKPSPKKPKELSIPPPPEKDTKIPKKNKELSIPSPPEKDIKIPPPPEKDTKIPPPPDSKDGKYRPKYGLLEYVFSRKKYLEEKKNLAFQEYRRDFEKWEAKKADILEHNKMAFEKWEAKKADILNRNKRALEDYKKELEEIEMQHKKKTSKNGNYGDKSF